MADTLAIRWPRSPGDPARCAVVRGSSAIGAVAATDGPPTAESLRAAVAAMKFGGKRCVVALPRSLATTRRLALPDVPDDDLPDLVRMQAATRSAAPLDQLALDFLPLPPGSADPSGGGEAAPGRAALSASVPAATVKAVREAVAGAGLELATVGLTAGGLANLVVARGGGGFGNTLVAARDGDRAELVVVAAGPAGPAVVLTHASHPHGDDDAQWNRALLADAARVLLSQSDAVPGGVTRAWAVGDGAADMAELLAGRFGCETTAAADWPALGLAGDAAGEFGPGPLGGAVGLAAPAALPALDFLSPRRRPEPEDRRLRNGLLAATAATVLVGGGWWYLDGQKRDLNDQIVVLNAEIDASQELLDLNAPLLEEDAAVAAWAAGVPAPRTELVRLDGFLPPTDTLYLTEFRLDPPAGGDRPVLKATGNAASAAVVRDLERTLDGAGYVLAPTDLKDRRVDPACPIRFVLTAEVPERTAEAAAGDAPPDGGGGPGDVRENRGAGGGGVTKSEKILAGVLGAAVAGYALRGPALALTVDPVRELEDDRAAKLERAEDLSDRKFALLLAKQRVDAARGRSLPADVSDAERLYPQWLADLAALSGFSEVQTAVQTVSARRGEQFRPVRVTLTGQARTEELDDFLRRFARTDLLHRVNRAVVDSKTPTGDVDLSVEIEAEAVSLPTATDRNALFPLAELAEPLPAGGDSATVRVPDDPTLRFPTEAPFLVRAGRELLTVTTTEPGEDGAATWTVDRGADGTDPADHSAGAFLQLWPTRPATGDDLALSETGPFRKPRTYAPTLTVEGPRRLVRGDEFALTAATADYDDRAGDPALAFADPPAGLALDPGTGRITWDPPADLPAGDYAVTLTAAVAKPETTLTEELTLTLAERNTPPTIESVPPQTVQAGDVLIFEVADGDAEDPAGVTLELVDPPAGATIDADFGVVRWAVPDDADLGAKTLTVRATDAGDPPLTAEAAVAVTVKEDLRPFVKYVGFNEIDGDPRAMLYNQAEDRTVRLAPGDDFDVADVRGVVRSIEPRSMTLERNDRLFELELGQSLSQARDLGPADGAADGDDAAPVEPAAAAAGEREAESDRDEVPAGAAAG